MVCRSQEVYVAVVCVVAIVCIVVGIVGDVIVEFIIISVVRGAVTVVRSVVGVVVDVRCLIGDIFRTMKIQKVEIVVIVLNATARIIEVVGKTTSEHKVAGVVFVVWRVV